MPFKSGLLRYFHFITNAHATIASQLTQITKNIYKQRQSPIATHLNRTMSSEEPTPATPAEEPKAAEEAPAEEAKPTEEEEEKVKEEESTATFEPVVSLLLHVLIVYD